MLNTTFPANCPNRDAIIRWLLDNDHDEEGIVVIADLYGGGDIHNPRAREEYRDIKMDVLLQRQEGERTYKDMFKRYKTRVFIAMSAQGLAQLNGINVISYYAPYVFESAGWIGHDAILMTGINGITYFLSTIPPWYIVDSWGRRPILLSGAVAMAISLSLISYFIFLDVPSTPVMVVVFVMIYNAAFGYSWGPIPWLYPPEILPLKIRSKGASLSTATNWAFNWLVGEMTPILQEVIGWRLYLVHAFFCCVSFVVGKSLSAPSPAPLRATTVLGFPLTHESSIFYLPGDMRCPSRGYGCPVWRCHCRAGHAGKCGHAVFESRGRVPHAPWLASAVSRHPRPAAVRRLQRPPGPGYRAPHARLAEPQAKGREGEARLGPFMVLKIDATRRIAERLQRRLCSTRTAG